jgi:hypothetical protein
MDTGDSTFGYRGSIRVKRIVVAADGSPASARGLEQVADLASRVGARVVVVYVRHLPSAALMTPGIADASAMQTLDEQEAMVRQEALRLLGGAGVEWEWFGLEAQAKRSFTLLTRAGPTSWWSGATVTARCTTCFSARPPRI